MTTPIFNQDDEDRTDESVELTDDTKETPLTSGEEGVVQSELPSEYFHLGREYEEMSPTEAKVELQSKGTESGHCPGPHRPVRSPPSQ